MVINPILIIITLAISIYTIIFCMLNKPKKPVLSGVFLALLVVYLICTYMINLMFTAVSDQSYQVDFINRIVCFVTATDTLTELSLESSFEIFKIIDICLMCLSMGFLVWDIRSIFIVNKSDDTENLN